MQTLESKEKVAKDVKDKFTALADRVRLFEAEIDVALDKADDAIKKDLENAKKHLNDLLEELERLVTYPSTYRKAEAHIICNIQS